MKEKAESRTLLWSLIMSAPGPLVVGLGLVAGRSATQTADFVRRSAELLGIVMAYVSYRLSTGGGETDLDKRRRMERFSNIFVGAMMCIGGSIMLVLAFTSGGSHEGNLIPGLAIAVMGLIANSIFWRRYMRLNALHPNPIIAVQARLYRAKSLVDGCVSAALLAVLIIPGTPFAVFLDRVGSAVVALYLLLCGIKTVTEKLEKEE